MNSEDKINILLVDDRPENLLALEAILEHDDYRIMKAYSGEEALKYLLKYDFAAILLDVQMPGMDGFGTAKIIKAREKTKHIPILFITANNMDSEHIFTGYSVGAIDYILKPVDPIIIKAKVEGFIQIYKLNRQLTQQAEMLTKKTKQLETANQELSNKTAELQISEALANVIEETSIDTMLIIDENGLVIRVNSAVKEMFQYEINEVVGKPILLLFSHNESKDYLEKLIQSLRNINAIVASDKLEEIIAAKKDGRQFYADIQIGRQYVQRRWLIALTVRDITKQKQDRETITHMAYHDSLTNLPNRRNMNTQLTSGISRARQTNRPLALMYLDLDRFKFINDSLGHITGDRLLQEIAQRLSECVREEDVLARVGGDEFNVLLPDTTREQALEVAEAILQAFQKPFFIDNYELFITACIGVSIFPYDGEDTLTLMKCTDAALYRAKEQGNNRYKVYHSGMNIQSYKSFILQNDLRKAVAQSELSVVYQPRFAIDTGCMKSAEALLRWQHPVWGPISPGEFIPLAEETGHIVEIGEWVFRTVCHQIKVWKEAGMQPVPISVNFSAQQFMQKDLLETIGQILQETGVSPNMIEIEITETVLMGNEDLLTKTLNQLRKIGIGISLDDFGTGYSSLNYLRRLPVNTLKIDRSFIADLSNENSNSGSLVSTIILLARNLNLTVVAEGVETEEQLAFLRKCHCGEAQGYYYSPPVSQHDFEKFLQQQHVRTSPVNHEVIYLENKKTALKEAAVTSIQATDDSESIPSQLVLNAALERTRIIYSISSREMDVFTLLVNGLSNKEISDQLFISEHTVKNHITRIFQKLAVNDRLQAMAKVYQTCIEEGEHLRAK